MNGSVARTFDLPGTYVVTLVVTDDHGLSDADTLTVRVESGDPDADAAPEAAVDAADGPGEGDAATVDTEPDGDAPRDPPPGIDAAPDIAGDGEPGGMVSGGCSCGVA